MSASCRVLVVDDEESVLRSLRRLLRSLGHTVSHARTVAEALATLDGHDVAIVDLLLPDGRGTEVVAAIRADGRPIRTALMTGNLDLETVAPSDVVFYKPVDIDAMMRWIGDDRPADRACPCPSPSRIDNSK